jgi:hypothetical protein
LNLHAFWALDPKSPRRIFPTTVKSSVYRGMALRWLIELYLLVAPYHDSTCRVCAVILGSATTLLVIISMANAWTALLSCRRSADLSRTPKTSLRVSVRGIISDWWACEDGKLKWMPYALRDSPPWDHVTGDRGFDPLQDGVNKRGDISPTGVGFPTPSLFSRVR